MEQAAVFKSNRSQAVRLPKSVALPADVTRVEVIVLGRARLLVPVGERWDSWFDEEAASPDFMTDRDMPPEQYRDTF